jgi:(p)ppGpp synthase/HD superfamily hydrolase
MQVSKLGKLQCKNEGNSKQDVKAEDLRQMFLAMTEEVFSFFVSSCRLLFIESYLNTLLGSMKI